MTGSGAVVEYVYRIDALTTLRQRLRDGVFRARRIHDVAAYLNGPWAHHQTRDALSHVAPGRVVLQMSWWKTIEAAVAESLKYSGQQPLPIQRVPATLPFFASFDRGDDEWLPDAWLYWGDEPSNQALDNPHRSASCVANTHFEILSPRGTWQPFDDADCFESARTPGAFDITLPPIHPTGFPIRLRVSEFLSATQERWLLIRNRASEIMPLPLYAPAAYRHLAAVLAQRVPALPHLRLALTFELHDSVRVAEIHRAPHRWRDRIRRRPAPDWDAQLLEGGEAAELLRHAGVAGLMTADRRFHYDRPALAAAGFALPV